MKNLLVSICLIVTFVIGCASPSSSASSTVTHRVPAILGHGPLSTARSLNADWGNSTVMNGMGMVVSAAPAIAITPLITGWTASSGNAVTGETLTYGVYGNLLTVVATVNVDNSVTYTGTFTNNTTVGPATAQPTNPTITVVQDGNDSSLLATLDPTGTTFSYTQKLYVNFWNPQSMTSDYQLAYQVYSNASGSGTITFDGYVASGTETFVGNAYTHTSTSSSAPPILASDSSISGAFVVADWTTSVQKVAFSIKSDAYNLALLLNQNFLTGTTPAPISSAADYSYPGLSMPTSPNSASNTMVIWKMTPLNPWVVANPDNSQGFLTYSAIPSLDNSGGATYPVAVPATSYSATVAYNWFQNSL